MNEYQEIIEMIQKNIPPTFRKKGSRNHKETDRRTGEVLMEREITKGDLELAWSTSHSADHSETNFRMTLHDLQGPMVSVAFSDNYWRLEIIGTHKAGENNVFADVRDTIPRPGIDTGTRSMNIEFGDACLWAHRLVNYFVEKD